MLQLISSIHRVAPSSPVVGEHSPVKPDHVLYSLCRCLVFEALLHHCGALLLGLVECPATLRAPILNLLGSRILILSVTLL